MNGGHARYFRANSLMPRAGVPSGRRNPDFSVFGQIDWTGYLRAHGDRRNLLIHVIAVPLFIGSFASLIVFIVRGDYVLAVIATIPVFIAMALQARGHALEAQAPVPFSGPGNFLKRWFMEQFLIFPLFFLTGRWWRQYKSSGGGSDSAA